MLLVSLCAMTMTTVSFAKLVIPNSVFAPSEKPVNPMRSVSLKSSSDSLQAGKADVMQDGIMQICNAGCLLLPTQEQQAACRQTCRRLSDSKEAFLFA